jgi:hypothetical protein
LGLRPQLLGKPRKLIFEFINFTSMKGLLMLTLCFTEGYTHVDVAFHRRVDSCRRYVSQKGRLMSTLCCCSAVLYFTLDEPLRLNKRVDSHRCRRCRHRLYFPRGIYVYIFGFCIEYYTCKVIIE